MNIQFLVISNLIIKHGHKNHLTNLFNLRVISQLKTDNPRTLINDLMTIMQRIIMMAPAHKHL